MFDISESRYTYDNPVQKKQARVTLQMYEINNELIKDLLTEPSTVSNYLEILESAERSVHVRVSIGLYCALLIQCGQHNIMSLMSPPLFHCDVIFGNDQVPLALSQHRDRASRFSHKCQQ